jgi:hypothetical protein
MVVETEAAAEAGGGLMSRQEPMTKPAASYNRRVEVTTALGR